MDLVPVEWVKLHPSTVLTAPLLAGCHTALSLGCCFWSYTSAVRKFNSDWEVLHNLGMKPHRFYGMTPKPHWNLIKDRDWSLFSFLKWSARFYNLNVIPYLQTLALWNCMGIVASALLFMLLLCGASCEEVLLSILSDDAQCWQKHQLQWFGMLLL